MPDLPLAFHLERLALIKGRTCMSICEHSVNINFPCRTMALTRASEAASSSARPRSRQTHVPLQDAQDPKSNLEIMMEDIGTDDTTGSGSNSRGPIREASSATDKEEDNLIYDREQFRKNKARCHYDFYYRDRKVIVERGVVSDL